MVAKIIEDHFWLIDWYIIIIDYMIQLQLGLDLDMKWLNVSIIIIIIIIIING